jgi:hypothetical protein
MQLKVLVGAAPSETATGGRARRLAAILVPRSHEHVPQEAYMISIRIGPMTRVFPTIAIAS